MAIRKFISLEIKSEHRRTKYPYTTSFNLDGVIEWRTDRGYNNYIT